MPKTECLVIKAFGGDLLVSIDENMYEVKEIEMKKLPVFWASKNGI